MTVVNSTVQTPAGAPVAGLRVKALLISNAEWLSSGTIRIIKSAETITDSAGAWSLTLLPQSGYEEVDTHYLILEGIEQHHCVVPAVGPVTLRSCLVDPATLNPSDPTPDPLYLARIERGAVNGVASLGADGKVPASQIPAGGATDHGALTGLADDDHTQYHNDARGDARYSLLGHNHSGVYAPVAHSHIIGDVTGLQTALDGKPNFGDLYLDYEEFEGAEEYHSRSCDPAAVRSGSGLPSWAIRMPIKAGKTITRVGLAITAAGSNTGGGLNAAAFYSDDGSTLLGQTINDVNWTLATGRRFLAMQSNIAAQAEPYMVRLVINLEGIASPTVAYAQAIHNAVVNGVGAQWRSVTKSNYSGSFPATIDPASAAFTAGVLEYIPFVMVG